MINKTLLITRSANYPVIDEIPLDVKAICYVLWEDVKKRGGSMEKLYFARHLYITGQYEPMGN